MGMVQGKSDPYAVIRVGTQTFRSKTIKANLNPEWYEMYEVGFFLIKTFTTALHLSFPLPNKL